MADVSAVPSLISELRGNLKMSNSIDPDFSSANRDLDEIIALAAPLDFDLYEFLRLLSEEGLPTLTCEVDEVVAGTARRRVARYQLGEKLKVLLSALRTGNLDTDEIKGGSSHHAVPSFVA
jgi:hypothetical protein